MHSQRTALTGFLGLAVALLSVVASRSDTAETHSLQLLIELHQPRVLLGEPVAVRLALINQGPRRATVAPCFLLGARMLTYWVSDPSGAVRPIQARSIDTVLVRPTILHPGEQITGGHVLVWEITGYTFPDPGEYRLAATFLDEFNSLRSNVVSLQVAQPEGVDAEASQLFFDDEVGDFLSVPSYQRQEGIARLNELLARYPDSTYAPYAAYTLAWRASKRAPFHSNPDGTVGLPAFYDQAIAGFQRVVREWPDSVVADDAQYELARTYSDMGDRAAAGDALQTFFETFAPTSDRLDDAIKLDEDTAISHWTNQSYILRRLAAH